MGFAQGLGPVLHVAKGTRAAPPPGCSTAPLPRAANALQPQTQPTSSRRAACPQILVGLLDQYTIADSQPSLDLAIGTPAAAKHTPAAAKHSPVVRSCRCGYAPPSLPTHPSLLLQPPPPCIGLTTAGLARYVDGRVSRVVSQRSLAHHFATLDMEFGGADFDGCLAAA